MSVSFSVLTLFPDLKPDIYNKKKFCYNIKKKIVDKGANMEKLLFSDWCVPDNVKIIIQISDFVKSIDHTHDFVEIFYVVEGSANHYYNGNVETCRLGDMFLILPDEVHGFREINNEVFIHRDIIISRDTFKQACDFLGDSIYDKILNGEKSRKVTLTGSMIERLENIITDINIHKYNAQEGTSDLFLFRSKALLTELLCLFYNKTDDNLNAPSWLKMILQKFNMKQYIKGGISSITNEIHFDKSYCCRVFKKYLGCSMTQYLLNVRLENALSLLTTTDLTMVEICDEIGISSVSYFTVAFRKKYGYPPRYFAKHGKNKLK